MNQIGTNLDYKYNVYPSKTAFKSGQESIAVQLPDIYDVSPESYQPPQTLVEKIKKVDLLGLVYPWLESPLLMIGSCFGLGYAVDKLGKTFEGEYAKSSVGKAAKFGDKIVESKFVQSQPVQTVLKYGEKGGGKVKNFFKNSDLLNAIFKTPSRPEWSMPLHEMLSQKQRIISEFSNILKTYRINDIGMIEPTQLGINKAEVEMLEKTFGKKISEISKTQKVVQVVMKRINPSIAQSEIDRIIALGDTAAASEIKSEILKSMGLTADQAKEIMKDKTGKFAQIVEDACKKVGNKIRISEDHYKILRKFQPFEKIVGCDGIFNKLHSINNSVVGGAKTKLGKWMSLLVQKLHRGFTFGGGKLGVLLFISPIIVEAIKNTAKAEPSEKVGTLAQGTIPHLTWVFTFPLALQIMHAFGGMQYAGMSADQVEKYREALKSFNEKAKTGGFANKAEYNTAKKGVLKLKEVKGPQNLLTKIGKKIGSFLTMDLETFRGYKNSNVVMNTLRRIPNFFKNVFGVPLRFVIWGLISMGVLEAIITKGISGLFGKHYDAMKEEENKANKERQKEFTHQDLQQRLLEAQAVKTGLIDNGQNSPKAEEDVPPVAPPPVAEIMPEQTPNVAQPSVPVQSEIIKSEPVDSYNYIPSQDSTIKQDIPNKRDNYTYIPSSDNVLKPDRNDPTVNKYVPSQLGANIHKTFDNSGLSNALKRADRAEKQAIQVLSGKF